MGWALLPFPFPQWWLTFFSPAQSISSTKSGRYRLYRDGLDGDGGDEQTGGRAAIGIVLVESVWAARIITVKSSKVGCSAYAAGWRMRGSSKYLPNEVDGKHREETIIIITTTTTRHHQQEDSIALHGRQPGVHPGAGWVRYTGITGA